MNKSFLLVCLLLSVTFAFTVANDGKHPGPKTIELVAREIEYAIW